MVVVVEVEETVEVVVEDSVVDWLETVEHVEVSDVWLEVLVVQEIEDEVQDDVCVDVQLLDVVVWLETVD